jgi:putative selenium metabolism protein SsnA
MLIKNANILTFDPEKRIINNGGITIDEKGYISQIFFNEKEINKFISEGYSGDIIDAENQFVIPGNICAHTHFYGAYSRGMYIPGDAPNAFPQILEKLWWRLDKSLDKEANYFSAMVCLIDAIKHGTTTLFDHHASPNAIEGSLDVIEKAVRESGVRASLCYEVTDRDGKEKSQVGIEENLRFLEKTSRNLDSMITGSFGLHASLTLDDDTLEEARKRCPDGTGFHIHAAEHQVDEYDSQKRSGMRVIERLDHFGILGPKTIIAHGVHIDSVEVFLLADSKTWLSHQPRSNMNNAVGLGNIESMLHAGVQVCLGNDGFSNAMWQEWKTTYLAHKLFNCDPRRMPADVIYKMAVENNRDLVRTLFNGLHVGEISVGASADLIFVDYNPFTEVTSENFPWHIVFGFRDSMVTWTIVNGKVLMKNRQLLGIDEKNITAEAYKVSKRVWNSYHRSF